MMFYLQYRDAPSDTPIIEFRSVLPLPVPRVGDRVQLFEPPAGSPAKAMGRVDAVEWAYRTRESDDEVAGELDIAARVWLTPDAPRSSEELVAQILQDG